ncbi:hypothetical protein V6N13_080521 [Hibiscus sabdariffa]
MGESGRTRADPSGSQKKYKVVESGDSVTRKDLGPYRHVVGVVAKDKVEVLESCVVALESCVVAWCRRGLRGKMLVEELQRASIVGCSVMRAAGDSVVLLFSSSGERRVFLESTDLDQLFARVTVWNPNVRDSEDGWSEIRVSDLQEDKMTRMNPLYGTSGEDDSGRDGAVRGMGDEFDTVGVVCREVTPEPRLCELELWWQCTAGLRVTEAVDEGSVPRLGWRAPDTVFESVSKSNGKTTTEILNFELEQLDNLNVNLVTGGLESIQPTEETNFCSTVEFVQQSGLARKVRSVNDLVVDSLPMEQRRKLLKRQGKGKRGRSQRVGDQGHAFANESLTDSDFVA